MKCIRPEGPLLGEAIRIFGSLGDASRLKLLRALVEEGGPLCQGALARRAGLSRANASRHLACLVQAGLVAREPAGNLVLFRPVLPVAETLCGLVCDHVAARVRTAYRSLA